MRNVSLLLVLGTLLGLTSGCGHDPNAGISRDEARKVARQLRPGLPPPPAGAKPGEPVSIQFPVDGPGGPPGQAAPKAAPVL